MKKLFTIFLLLTSIAFSQTTITKVIDPGGTGNFTSLQAWATWVNSSTSGNLVTANVIEVARCICTNGQADNLAVQGSGSSGIVYTTDATHYIKIYADTNYEGINYRHRGVYPASGNIYRLEVTPTVTGNGCIQINTSKIIIDGLAIKNIMAGTIHQQHGIMLYDCDQGGYITNCIILNDKDASNENQEHGHGIMSYSMAKFAKYYIHNNIFIGFNNDSSGTPVNCAILTVPVGDSSYQWIDNNTFYSDSYGVWNRGGWLESGLQYDTCRVYFRNNVYQNPTTTGGAPSPAMINGIDINTSNSVSLPISTPAGTVYSNGFEDGTVGQFTQGDTSNAAIFNDAYYAHSSNWSLEIFDGWSTTPIDIYTTVITGLTANTEYTLSFWDIYGWGDVFTVSAENTHGGTTLCSVNTSTSDLAMTEHSISFNSGSNTSVIIDINLTGVSGVYSGITYFDDFSIAQVGEAGASAYFVNPAGNDLHLVASASLCIGQAVNLSADVNDPFSNDIDGGVRPSLWDIGADQFDVGSSDTSNLGKSLADTASSAACVNYAPNDSLTAQLERQSKVSFQRVEGYFTAYKVFSPYFFTYIQNQNYGLFTDIIQSAGNIYMNGQCTVPAFDLPMKAIVTGSPQDSINVVTGIPLTGTQSIELRSVPSGEAGLANKIQTIIGRAKTSFYTRWQMYVPANYIAHGAPWTYGGFEDQSFFYIVDSSNTHEFYLDFQQDTTNRNNILIYADTATGYPSNNTSITITRGSAIQIELYYKVGSPAKLWVAPIDSSFSSSSPTFTLPDSPMVPLNGEIIYGLGWSDLGSSPIYVNNFAVDSAFIPDTYINQPMATYLWGNLDQSVSSNIAYGSNIPIIGLNDSCLAHGIKPKLSIGGWPGAYTGLTADSTVGVTTWTSNTPWNFMMKDTTSSWLDANSITRNTGLRGHWIYNLIKLFEKTAFVGVDFDFEYVGMDTIGLAAKYQAKLFPDFLQAVRNSFDTAGHPTWSLTFCAPIPWGNTFPDTAYSADTNAYGHYYWMGSGSPLVAADSILWGNFDDRWMDWNRFYSTCDEIHLMTYGFSGIWDPHNSFNGAIWKTPPGVNGNYFCMDEVDSVITARGFSKVKTSIGFGFFGTVWLHNSDLWEPIGGLYNNDPPYGKGTWATTVTIGNSDLLYPNSYSGDWTSLKQLGATYGWCNTFAQPFYKYNIPGAPITFPQCGIDSLEHGTAAASSDFIVSYDDSLSTSCRMKWAYNKGYKSIFIWEITQDFEPDANGVLRPALEDAMAANITPFIPPLAWLPVLLVSNHAPTPPVTYPRAQLISPVNINTDQEPIFSWHPDSGATGYDLQVASDTLFSNSSLVINVLNLQDTTYASMFETFTQGQNYYWRVKSILSNTLVNSLIDNFSIINTNSSAVLTPSLLTLTSTPVGNKFKITVPWTIWYVSNQGYEPTSARVYLNGVLVAQQDSNFQFSSYTMTPDTLTATVGWGKYLVYLVTYNMFGEQIAMNYDSIFTGSSGAPMQPDVSYINIISDHPSISIDSAGCEGDVIVIQDSTTYNFCLQSPGAIGTFTVLNKDLSFFSTFSLSGNILTVRATRGGLTGLEIQYSQNGLVRYVGLAVKDWTGTIPKFPPYVSIGGLTQFYSAALPFYKDIRNGNADDNKRFDQGAGYYYYYGYLTDGHLDIFIRQSLRFGLYPGFTWYNINEGNDSPAGVVYGLTDTSSTGLPEYYTGLKGMLQHCDSIMHGVPLFLTLEPDMIGYLKIGYTSTYLLSSFTCKVNQAYSTGVLTTGVDPAFPNDLTGFCKSLNYIIKKYYPPSCIGWAFPQWACTHNVNKGIMHATDSGYPSGGNYSTGRTLIQNDFLELSSISITLGLNYLTDWMNIEGYGYDGALGSGGSNSVNWTNPDTTSWFWNAQYYDNLILAAHTMNLPISSGGTGLPVILGGDAGHIDSSLTKSPYNSNGSFANLTDSFFQWEDAASDYFFGDSMSISSGNRLNYFSVQPPADPADIIVSGNSVIWNQHLTYAKNNGVIGVMFGAGMTVDTHNLPDGTGASPNNIPTDNYWWITKVQRYYQNPVYK